LITIENFDFYSNKKALELKIYRIKEIIYLK